MGEIFSLLHTGWKVPAWLSWSIWNARNTKFTPTVIPFGLQCELLSERLKGQNLWLQRSSKPYPPPPNPLPTPLHTPTIVLTTHIKCNHTSYEYLITFPWSPPPTPTPHQKSLLSELFWSLHFSVAKLMVRFCVGLHSPSTSRQWHSSFMRNFLGCRCSVCAHVKTPVHAPETHSVVEAAIYLWTHTQPSLFFAVVFVFVFDDSNLWTTPSCHGV